MGGGKPMMIKDLNGHVEKALNEIEMRYSRGLEFTIFDLMTTSSCKEATNFVSYRTMLEARISNRGIAACCSIKNGIRVFRKK